MRFMKKSVVIPSVLLVVVMLWWCLNKKPSPDTPEISAVTETKVITAKLKEDFQALNTPNTDNSLTSSPVSIPANEAFNALAATNLTQWKQTVKELTQLGGFKYEQHWIMEMHNSDRSANRNIGKLFVFNHGGKTITYEATFISITTKGNIGNILQVELQTPNMNIEETKKLGLQLCNMFNWDSSGFQAWCDKTGNRWLDAPLYGTGDHDHTFNVRNTFNNEKPWYIDFVIASPQ